MEGTERLLCASHGQDGQILITSSRSLRAGFRAGCNVGHSRKRTTKELDVVTHTCHLSPREAEARESLQVQGSKNLS